MQNVLLVLQLLLAVGLIAVILVQRTAQDGGGLTGGGSTMGGMFTARGSANIITRTTAILATIFILNSLALGYLASRAHERTAIEKAGETAPISAPATPEVPKEAAPVPAAPEVPAAK